MKQTGCHNKTRHITAGKAASLYVAALFVLHPLVLHNGYFDITETKQFLFVVVTVGFVCLWLLQGCCCGEKQMRIRGESLGGGKVRIVRINQVEVDFTGEYSAVIVVHKDRPGVIAHITRCLTNCNVNIAFLKLFREDKGATAYSIIESDEKLPLKVIDEINENPNVYNTMLVQDPEN